MTHAEEQRDFDLDEDLFDFAGVKRDSDAIEPEEDLEEIFASFRDAPPPEELLAIPAAPVSAPVLAPAPAAAAKESAPPPRPSEPRAAPRAVVPAPVASERYELDLVREIAPAPRPSRVSRGVLAVALSVTMLNSVLAVVMMRGHGSDEPRRAGDPLEVEPHEPLALAAPPHGSGGNLPDPEAVEPVHSHPALDEARAEISRGEYAAARQRVYGLLSIIDRLEDPRRSALEADCQFLIAQSLHLEALARMGASQ